ncbi:MAG TPA: glycerophosphodiester phosphodiesterase [Terriglobales bacterium]|nr:glycerophosphodiester phosphodiesterase [Terriglobales bacterium]
MKRAQRPLLLGHRGARKAAPENTLAAFDLALAHGCDGFEFDVRRTADGEAVVVHDATVAGMEVAATAYEQLRQAVGGKEGPPTLEQVLARYAARAVLDIEVKVRGLEERVARLLRQYPPQREYVISSFQPEVLVALRLQQADLPLGYISDRAYALVAWPKLPVQYVMLHLDLLTQKRLEKLQVAGKKVFVWTVNETRDMVRLAEAGVDAIISDDTELLVRTMKLPR